MLLKRAIEILEKSKEFKGFKKENPDFYLAHAFTIIDKIQEDWQIGYYSKTRDKVVVFIVGKKITITPEEEVFKKPEKKITGLDMKNVKIDLEKAVEQAQFLVDTKYKGEIVSKTIVIVQNLEKELYNMTLVTLAMNIINIKVDAVTGKVIHHERQSIMGLGKQES
ncbi:MAG: hypothetical protein ABH828_01270 [archaeon]